jgi:hypothetical protein
MSSICRLQVALTLFTRHLSQATLACRLGCLGEGDRDFASLLPGGTVALVIHLSSIIDFTKANACLASFFGVVYFSVSF